MEGPLRERPLMPSSGDRGPVQPRAFIAEFQPETRGMPADPRAVGAETWECSTNQGRMSLRLIFRNAQDRGPSNRFANPLTVLLGSDAEWERGAAPNAMGDAATIQWDAVASQFTVRTSIIGLPPIFIYRSSSRTVLTSDLWLLRSSAGIELTFDETSLRQMCRVGYPIGFRTLFKDVSVIPGGVRLDVDRHGALTVQEAWRMPAASPARNRKELIELQTHLFRDAVRRINIDRAFLSLTGGLDTRTILAAILEAGGRIPAYTMSWKGVSLDARLAVEICRPYGVPHEVVRFDESFASEISERALTASRLSGGLAAVEQATEVAFYNRVGAEWRSRISGFLGNQVGRGGQEGISLRRGDVTMLVGASAGGHGERRPNDAVTLAASVDPHARMRHSVLFASLANYCLGHHYMEQASPYASRQLIESLAHHPSESGTGPESALQRRARDLRHRFLGEPVERSFQRQLITSVGGHVAHHPINWGWRATGGVSAAGLAHGALAFIEAFASWGRLRATRRRMISTLPGIVGRHNFRQPRLWWSRDLLQSVILDKDVRESGLFVVPVLQRKIEEHFAGVRDHLDDLLLAADLAYAHRAFRTQSGLAAEAAPALVSLSRH